MMKKRFLGGFAVVVIAAIAAWNVSFSSKADGMSDIMLANVEALANNEFIYSCIFYGCRFAPDFDCWVYSGGILINHCFYHWGL